MGYPPEFVLIPNIEGKNIPDFGKMQEEVNEVQVIIGTYYEEGGTGHIVMIVPASIEEIEKRDIDGITTIVPKILECGRREKRN